jgi:hypothetical protein
MSDLLILHDDEFMERAARFQRKLSDSPSFRRAVTANPSGSVAQSLFPGQRPPAAAISKANRLFFALMSNDKFRRWAESYGDEVSARARRKHPELSDEEAIKLELVDLNRAQVYRDAAEAGLKFVDREALLALVSPALARPSASGEPVILIEDHLAGVFAILFLLLLILGVYTVIPVDSGAHDMLVPHSLTREDVQRVAEILVSDLTAQAKTLRERGDLLGS